MDWVLYKRGDLLLCKETTEPVRLVEPVAEHKTESAGFEQ